MAKKNKKGKKSGNPAKSTAEDPADKDFVTNVGVDDVENNDVNEAVEAEVEEEANDDEESSFTKDLENDEPKVELKEEEKEVEENKDSEEADTTADKFVIVDSEDESDIDEDFTLKKPAQKEEPKEEIPVVEETKPEEPVEETIPEEPVVEETKLEAPLEESTPEPEVKTSEVVETVKEETKEEPAQIEESKESEEVEPIPISEPVEEPKEESTSVQIETPEVKPVSIGQQAYDPYDQDESPEVQPVTIGQQAYDPYDEEEQTIKEVNTSVQQPNVSFITPTPQYKYIENEDKKLKLKELTSNFVFGLAVVDFDHVKGPELTYWLDDEVIEASGKEGATDDTINGFISEKVQHYSKIWPYLAFQALPDGVHMYDETFAQFTLCYDELKKSDVELSFDLVDLIHSESAQAPASEKKEPITTTEPVKKDGFENVDFQAEKNPNSAADGDNLLERVSTRPVITTEDPNQGVVTLFGCACIRQLGSSLLKKEDSKANLKRSVIQKSVILLTRSPLPIQLREKLSIVTQSWFEQCDFTDCEILKSLYINVSNTYNKNGYVIEDDDLYEVNHNKKKGDEENETKVIKESDFYMGLNFQEVVSKLRRNLLVIYKTILLGNSKILFFSKDLNALSNSQYCLIGLISNLLLNLSDCGYPLSDLFLHEEKIKSKSLKSSDRSSILRFLGLPLRIFGFGSFFQPYLTLQQLSYITNINTKSFIVGSSNDIILEHKNNWFDMVVYLDEKESGLFGSGGCKIEILNKSLKDKVNLTWDDKKFIDYVINSVETHYAKADEDKEKEVGEIAAEKTTSEAEKIKSKTVNSNMSIDNGSYKGGDDFIRSQFEDYLIGFLSCCKYDRFLIKREDDLTLLGQLELDLYANDIDKFNHKWVEEFRKTQVFRYWDEITEDELFNFFEPKHVSKDVGKDAVSENKFKGGEVFKNWINKWNTGGKKAGDNSGANNGTDSAAPVVSGKEGEGGGEGEGEDGESADKAAVDAPAAANNVKVTMNNFGRDVGQFFKRIGDNTSATFQQRMHSTSTSTGTEAVKQESRDKELPPLPAGDDDDVVEAVQEGQSSTEDAKTRAGDGVSPDTTAMGSVEGVTGVEADKDKDTGTEQMGTGFENKLRNLFQWKK